MKTAICRLLVSAVVVLGACGTPVEEPAQVGPGTIGQLKQGLSANRGILLIDRTGSMMLPRATGNTRCADALTMAHTRVAQFFYKYGGAALSIWTFNGSSTTRLVEYVTTPAMADAAIDTLSTNGCTDMTPLADAICQAADELGGSMVSGRDNWLAILTDGEENNSTGPCSGNSNELIDTNSWRAKTFLRVVARRVAVEPGFLQGASFLSARKTDPETGLPVPVAYTADGAPRDLDHETMLAYATYTGGSYDLMNDTDARYACRYGSCPGPYYEPRSF